MNEQIIYRYLSGTATEEEQQALLAWLHESAVNQDVFFETKAIWNARKQLSNHDKNKKASLAEINARIDAIEKPRKSVKFYTRWGCAAAILLVVAVSSYLHMHDSVWINEKPHYAYTNYTTPDSILKVTFPDGTLVWLADSTSLDCLSDFGVGRRVVYLDGMAFFDVFENKELPFVVQTDMEEVTVTGTSFSINTRMPEECCETILMTGSVQLRCGKKEKTVTLSPGQQALYSRQSGKLEIKEVDVNSQTSWRYGIISLSDVCISEILNKLEEVYRIHIKMDISSIQTNRYNFSFKSALNPRKALEQLSKITGQPVEATGLAGNVKLYQ